MDLNDGARQNTKRDCSNHENNGLIRFLSSISSCSAQNPTRASHPLTRDLMGGALWAPLVVFRQ